MCNLAIEWIPKSVIFMIDYMSSAAKNVQLRMKNTLKTIEPLNEPLTDFVSGVSLATWESKKTSRVSKI